MRRLIVILLFLLAGAVVNVAVAWGCAAFVPMTGLGLGKVRSDPLRYPPEKSSDFDIRWEGLWSATGVERHSALGTYATFSSAQAQLEELLSPPRNSLPAGVIVEMGKAGLPLRCLQGHQFYVPSLARKDVTEGIKRVNAWPMRFRDGRPNTSGAVEFTPDRLGFLPLRPIWPRFAVNTLFYAAVLWQLIHGPFALRRFIRIRRGLCPKCAYPTGESSICSECGKALPGRTEAMT